uniref:Sulfotransferase n=1 Tax=Janibacter limosus TaxID=53458 RepID=A0AC61U6D7_9MICO|nr:sulfotransferase [Janibacter limosus]
MSQQVIIVGAPRSGTNMLRDVLTSAPGGVDVALRRDQLRVEARQPRP